MKPISFIKISASLLAMVAMVATTSLQAAAPANNITKGKGEVKKSVGTTNVKEGQVLKDGDKITTGPNSAVEIWLGVNGQLLRIPENSEVLIEELTVEKVANEAEPKVTTKLELKSGGLIGEVKKLSKASNYEVKHAQGVAGIRGTEYAIFPGQGVICTSGTVVVRFMVNGIPSAPITLGPNQVALPPAQPGGPPIIVPVSPEMARFLARVAEILYPGGRVRGPGNRGRDVRVVVSAFAERDGDTEETEVNQTPQ
jgi:hypothetical protein